jgi:RNA polymerase sigma-70 factor (ECF subfamily)
MVEIPQTRVSLLVRLRDRRDECAWKEFVDLYVPVIYGYARRQGLQDADAVDLSQEVISAVASSLCRLEYDPERGSFRGWLFTLVRRKLSNFRRDRKHRPCGDSAARQLLEQYAVPSELEAAWEAEWEQRLFAWACAQARRTVTDTTWQAFWRTAIDGHNGKRVAAELGLTVAAVYLARSRVVARLKELIGSVAES